MKKTLADISAAIDRENFMTRYGLGLSLSMYRSGFWTRILF